MQEVDKLGFWDIILPVAKQNLSTNPSLERGTAGWGTHFAGTIGTISSVQAFGAWSGSVAPTSNGTAGCVAPTFTAGNGTAYSISAYVRGANGIPYMLAVGDSNGANLQGSVLFTGGGTWQRYDFKYTESAGAVRRPVIRKNASADTSAFYVDAVQVEVGSVTTYIDGDQAGGTWLGPPHASVSQRSGQYRLGGSIVSLNTYGLVVMGEDGIGMPPIENIAQPYAQLPGAFFQRSRPATRLFTLTSNISGTTFKDLHAQRRALIDGIRTDPQQPFRLLYTGAGGTTQIDVVYDGGMEFGKPDGFSETFGLRVAAYDVYFQSMLEEGTTLPPFTNLGSTNFIAYRDPQGRWGTLGANGTTIDTGANGGIFDVAFIGTTTYIGGAWQTIGGTAYRNIGQINNGQMGTLIGGTYGGGTLAGVLGLTTNPLGTLFVAGQGSVIAGTAGANFFVQYANNAWGTLVGGTVNGIAYAAAVNAVGTVFVVGLFDGVAGTASSIARNIAFYFNGSWGRLSGGTLNSRVESLAIARSGSLWAGGQFTLAGGSDAHGLAVWGSAWHVPTGGTFDVPTDDFAGLAITANGDVYASNQDAVGGGTQFARIRSMSAEIVGTANISSDILGLTAVNNTVYAAMFSQGANNSAFIQPGYAFYSAGAWRAGDILLDTAATAPKPVVAKFAPDGTMYLAGYFRGTALAASVNTIVSDASADTPITLTMRNTGAGTVLVKQLLNTTTGAGIWMNLVIAAGDQVVLDTTPGSVSLTSAFYGNVIGAVVPGSNLGNWRLQPGTNFVSFLANSGSLTTALTWRNRYWSADSTASF